MNALESQLLQNLVGPTVKDIVQSLPNFLAESFVAESPASFTNSTLVTICDAFVNHQTEAVVPRIPLPACLCCEE